MDLTYSVSSGKYGVRPNLDVDGTSFGTQGAVVCVIVLVKKEDGTLFCGHMDCGYSGIPGNRAVVIEKATALVAEALPNDQDTANWWISSQLNGDPTNGWMRTGIMDYFDNPPQVNSETTDAAFLRDGGNTTPIFGNDYIDGEDVDTGNFSVIP